ncbi:MAG: glutaredoxin 3 [Rhodospirillales bacterium]|nr:glutaredoxin 3 [Rhodospirillales bacterium]MCW8862371.1 glutaredoxin 3 [Rhodospirillales bacterium]MCW9001776.1 glutaredoxin 3 [Rhodospirillales bacterium]MCW9040138.1 glutaredoxin 3 [Rhodospirillales bacterium]
MAKVEIYTSGLCPYCYRAKKLLAKKGVDFIEYDVTAKAAERQKMSERANGRTSVPQIFINDAHVGGCDDLFELDFDGALDKMLGQEA